MPCRCFVLPLVLGFAIFVQPAIAAVPPAGLEARLDAILSRGAPGVSVLVYRDGELLYRMDRGRIAPGIACLSPRRRNGWRRPWS